MRGANAIAEQLSAKQMQNDFQAVHSRDDETERWPCTRNSLRASRRSLQNPVGFD